MVYSTLYHGILTIASKSFTMVYGILYHGILTIASKSFTMVYSKLYHIYVLGIKPSYNAMTVTFSNINIHAAPLCLLFNVILKENLSIIKGNKGTILCIRSLYIVIHK